MRHFLNLMSVAPDELTRLLSEAARLKIERKRGHLPGTLEGRVAALIFEKPSLRTRVSFESGMAQLGGTSMFIAGSEIGLGVRETLPDFARTMSRFVDFIILRVFKQSTVDTVAQYATCPVINGLSDTSHPCQALADLQTIQEQFGTLAGRTVVFVGDGNNVARSLAVGCGKLGLKFVLSCPEGYGFDGGFAARWKAAIAAPFPEEVRDPRKAVKNADAIYSDVFTSMGQEAESARRMELFMPYQVDAALLRNAPKSVKFMHCLPAHRGEEVTDEVIEGPASVVFDQAENRLHAQKAILEWLHASR